jgi:hypothetical protein
MRMAINWGSGLSFPVTFTGTMGDLEPAFLSTSKYNAGDGRVLALRFAKHVKDR